MEFTDGKDRFCESLMKEIPNYKKRGCGGCHAKFKYRFRDLDCRFCAEYKSCPSVCLCPYILDNLPDLLRDGEFAAAVLTAPSCGTPQRLTLLYLLEGRICV